jgi:hypothetical protein
MRLKILILYHLNPGKGIRKTIDDHLYSFKRYTEGVDYHYWNALYGVPKYIMWADYDGVILHYTLLGERWRKKDGSGRWFEFWRSIGNLKRIGAPKVALPQDEYAHTADLWAMFNEFGVETVFSCATEKDFRKLYPKGKVRIKHYFHVFTGYVDEDTLDRVGEWMRKGGERQIDIGYRARKLPYWLGRHGRKKCEIGVRVADYVKKRLDLNVDISSNPEDVFWGDDWLRFLLKCKAVLGCEGGASMMDPEGQIRACVEGYMKVHKDAAFEEVEEKCFPRRDGSISLFNLGPRHFEAVMTKTCQVLLEGRYAGVFKPNIHYIELKSDYSNLGKVVNKVKDEEYRKRIVERAYEDIALSGKYTYRAFANRVVDHIRDLTGSKKDGSVVADLKFGLVGLMIYGQMWLRPVLRRWRYFCLRCVSGLKTRMKQMVR